MGKIYLDDSFDGRKLEHIGLKKKVNVDDMLKKNRGTDRGKA